MDSDKIFLTVIVPIFNEENNIDLLYREILKVSKDYTNYEIVFVNDGSKDSSEDIINKLCEENQFVKLINLSRNFGHQIAITAGLKKSKGDVVVIIDGDLQDPPEVIPKLIEKWKDGYEVVYAIRQKRKENFFKRIAYFMFYRILKTISDINIPLDSGDFSAIDRKVVDQMNKFPERNRFVRGIRSWVGFNQVGVKYERSLRFSGEPKYSYNKLLKLAYDGLISFSHRPLKIATKLGVITTLMAFIIIVYILYLNFFRNIDVRGWSSTIVVILFLGGIQLLMIGALGEYIARIYDEVRSRPNYIISYTKNIDANE